MLLAALQTNESCSPLAQSPTMCLSTAAKLHVVIVPVLPVVK
jgi:hypothetical protein